MDPEEESLRALEEDLPALPATNLPAFYRIGRISATPAREATSEQQNAYEQFRRANQAVRDASSLIRANDRQQAMEILSLTYNELTDESARFVVASRLGTLYFRNQEFDLAATFMEDALEIRPDNAPIVCNLAAALLSTGQVEKALDYLESLQPESIQSRNLLFSLFFNRACAYSLQNRLDTSMENLARAANVDPASTVASMGDVQLDNVRTDPRFLRLQEALEKFVLGKES